MHSCSFCRTGWPHPCSRFLTKIGGTEQLLADVVKIPGMFDAGLQNNYSWLLKEPGLLNLRAKQAWLVWSLAQRAAGAGTAQLRLACRYHCHWKCTEHSNNTVTMQANHTCAPPACSIQHIPTAQHMGMGRGQNAVVVSLLKLGSGLEGDSE